MKFFGEIGRLFGKGKKQDSEQIEQRLNQLGQMRGQGAMGVNAVLPENDGAQVADPSASDIDKIRLQIQDARSQLTDSAGSTREQIAQRIETLQASLTALESKKSASGAGAGGTTMEGPGGFSLPAQDSLPPKPFTPQPRSEAPQAPASAPVTPDKAA